MYERVATFPSNYYNTQVRTRPESLLVLSSIVDTRKLIFTSILTLLFSGCSARKIIQDADRRHLYQEITNQRVHKFVEAARKRASRLYGETAIPIRQILIYRSLPKKPNSDIRQNFQETSISLKEPGTFVIFMSSDPSEYRFFGSLLHEVLHLQNNYIHDVYMEGLCTVFAEEIYKENSQHWEPWIEWFNSGADPFYGATYQMMRDIAAVTDPESLHRLLKFAVPLDREGRQKLDINAWLNTIPKDRRLLVSEIIKRHTNSVTRAMPNGFGYGFDKPE